MPASRLPFMLEDLRAELERIRGSEGGEISIGLDAETYEKTSAILRSQSIGISFKVIGGGEMACRYNGISITRASDAIAPA